MLGQWLARIGRIGPRRQRVVALNRVFKVVYRVRLAMKSLKKANRKIDYAIKYVVLGGLLAAFVVWA